jgi:hypothetical protein
VPYDPEPLPDTPVQAPGPIAWEAAERAFLVRLFGTLRATFSPLTTIRAAATGELSPALRFGLLWMVPWMLLWAILPFTHTLNFTYFRIEVIQKPGDLPIVWDVARAMAIGFTHNALILIAWAVPFASLLRAFGKAEPGVNLQTVAYRVMLYRSWVVPCALTLFALSGWALPPEPNPILVELAFVTLRLLPPILLLMHCFATARYFGVEGLASIAVAMVPLMVVMAAGQFIDEGAAAFAPPPMSPPP